MLEREGGSSGSRIFVYSIVDYSVNLRFEEKVFPGLFRISGLTIGGPPKSTAVRLRDPRSLICLPDCEVLVSDPSDIDRDGTSALDWPEIFCGF